MKRINKKSEIPELFNLMDYESLYKLPDEIFINHIMMRVHRLNEGFSPSHYSIEIEDFLMELFERRIFDIEKVYTKEKTTKKCYSEQHLTCFSTVRPVTLSDIVKWSESIDEHVSFNGLFRSLRGQKKSISKTVTDESELVINVNLDYSDELIISEFKRAISTWRTEMEVSASKSDSSIHSWSVIKRKIIDYKIIPLMDLFCWARMKNVTITNSLLASLLYTDHEYDTVNLAQTIKPFLEKTVLNFSIEGLLKKINEEN